MSYSISLSLFVLIALSSVRLSDYSDILAQRPPHGPLQHKPFDHLAFQSFPKNFLGLCTVPQLKPQLLCLTCHHLSWYDIPSMLSTFLQEPSSRNLLGQPKLFALSLHFHPHPTHWCLWAHEFPLSAMILAHPSIYPAAHPSWASYQPSSAGQYMFVSLHIPVHTLYLTSFWALFMY